MTGWVNTFNHFLLWKKKKIPILKTIFVCDSSESLSNTEENTAEVVKHTDKIKNNQQYPTGITEELKVKWLNDSRLTLISQFLGPSGLEVANVRQLKNLPQVKFHTGRNYN